MKLLTPVSLLLAALALGSACRSTPNPGPILLSTHPPEARVFIPSLGYEYWTPCSLSNEVDGDTEIEISLAGYPPFSGRLGELPQTAQNHYHLTFVR